MFSAWWKIGLNNTYRELHTEEVTTVVFNNNGPVETKWKRIFSLFNHGLYWRKK